MRPCSGLAFALPVVARADEVAGRSWARRISMPHDPQRETHLVLSSFLVLQQPGLPGRRSLPARTQAQLPSQTELRRHQQTPRHVQARFGRRFDALDPVALVERPGLGIEHVAPIGQVFFGIREGVLYDCARPCGGDWPLVSPTAVRRGHAGRSSTARRTGSGPQTSPGGCRHT